MTRAEKKQIPQKVVYEDIGYDQYKDVNVYACICPSCGLYIIKFDDEDVAKSESDEPEKMFHDCMIHHAYAGWNNYCHRCGQKLGWKQYEHSQNNK